MICSRQLTRHLFLTGMKIGVRRITRNSVQINVIISLLSRVILALTVILIQRKNE